MDGDRASIDRIVAHILEDFSRAADGVNAESARLDNVEYKHIVQHVEETDRVHNQLDFVNVCLASSWTKNSDQFDEFETVTLAFMVVRLSFWQTTGRYRTSETEWSCS